MNEILGQDVSNSGDYQLSIFDFFREIILHNFYSKKMELIRNRTEIQVMKSSLDEI